MMASHTRSSQFPLFEEVHDIKINQLPTYGDILKCILWCKVQKKNENGKDPSVKQIVKIITDKVIEIYERASIPIVSKVRVNELIFAYHLKYKKVIKNYKSNLESQITKLDAFKDRFDVLFDFCSCKCKNFRICACLREKKITKTEKNFLMDQRNDRKMFIGGLDPARTSKTQELQEINRWNKTREELNNILDLSATVSGSGVSSSQSSSTEIDDSDEFLPPKTSMKRIMAASKSMSVMKKAKSLPCFAEACDRVGVSDRGAALLSSSLLEDIGLVAAENEESVIDRNKVRRERNSMRSKQMKIDLPIKAIYFDGKRDNTMTVLKKNGKSYKQKITEEHIALVSEPNSEYVGHFTPEAGTARSITNGLAGCLDENGKLL